MVRQSGQILLVVVLSMIVALTVGLSLAARLVTELKLSKQNEESQRAFQAAESGILQTLARKESISSVTTAFGNQASFSTTYAAPSGATILLNNGQEVDQIVGSDVWLSDYSSDPSLIYLSPMGGGAAVPITIYWASLNQDVCGTTDKTKTEPALEIILIKGPRTDPTIQRTIIDRCSRIPNGLAVNTNVTGYPLVVNSVTTTFKNNATLLFNGAAIQNGLLMRIIPIYNSTNIGLVSTGGNFPAQGSTVESTGTSGETVRKVTYFQSFPQLPIEIFPYSKISQ